MPSTLQCRAEQKIKGNKEVAIRTYIIYEKCSHIWKKVPNQKKLEINDEKPKVIGSWWGRLSYKAEIENQDGKDNTIVNERIKRNIFGKTHTVNKLISRCMVIKVGL